MLNDSVPLTQVRRALVVKLRHHGDVLLASPVLSVLKNHVPNAEIDALVYADTAAMLSLHPALAQLHTIDRNWKHAGVVSQLKHEWALLKTLRDRRYDLVVHLTQHRRGMWLARGLGARWAVAPVYAAGGKSWRRSFTHLYSRPNATWRHTVETNLDALRRIGCQPRADERGLTLVAGPEAEARVDALLAEFGLGGRPFIHLHPTSRWHFKCWPQEQNARLVESLDAAGWPVVITASPDEQERRYVEDIVRQTRGRPINIAGQLNLKELAALTARASVFVGVDSAPMHIAAAVGTPTVALFGPSGEGDWGPWQVAQRVITSRHPCRPCGQDGCGGGKVSECLTTLPVEPVLAAVLELAAGA